MFVPTWMLIIVALLLLPVLLEIVAGLGIILIYAIIILIPIAILLYLYSTGGLVWVLVFGCMFILAIGILKIKEKIFPSSRI